MAKSPAMAVHVLARVEIAHTGVTAANGRAGGDHRELRAGCLLAEQQQLVNPVEPGMRGSPRYRVATTTAAPAIATPELRLRLRTAFGVVKSVRARVISSSEGACAAYYRYRRHLVKQQAA